jgi:hypothetical protein
MRFLEDFNFSNLLNHFNNNLPYYAIPIILLFKSNLVITSTFKFKKGYLKRDEFDLEYINYPFYILLPGNSEYTLQSLEIYKNIKNKIYKF